MRVSPALLLLSVVCDGRSERIANNAKRLEHTTFSAAALMRIQRMHALRSRDGYLSLRGPCQLFAAVCRLVGSLMVLFVPQGSLQAAPTSSQLIRRCIFFCFAVAVVSACICVVRLSGLFTRSCKGGWTTAAQAGERPHIAIVTFKDSREMVLKDYMYDMLGIEDPKKPLDILGLTWHNKQQYAQSHGYALVNGTHLQDHSRPEAWSKLLIAMDTLRATPEVPPGDAQSTSHRYDWILYLDADTVITNPAVQLEDIIPAATGPDFVVPLEPAGVNAGAWFVRNTEWSHQFLQTWWSSSEFVRAPGDHSTKSGDNDALKYIVQHMDPVTRDLHIGMTPNCAFNSYMWRTSARTLLRWVLSPTSVQQSIWQAGDFAVHLAGFVDKAVPLRALRRRGWRQNSSPPEHVYSRRFHLEASKL